MRTAIHQRTRMYVLALSLVGCGGDGTSPTTDPAATGPVATIQINPSPVALNLATSVQLAAQARNAAGVLLLDRPISWSTTNPGIATVNNTGLLTGAALGSTNVVAIAEGVSDTVVVQVNPVPISQDWGTSTPTLVQGPEFSEVTAGFEQTCALDVDGRAWCWGGGADKPSLPSPVPGGYRFASITTGNGWTGGHTCALDAQGTAFCWGVNQFGQLGNGTTASNTNPTAVVGGITFTQLTAGQTRVCGLATNGEAWCWGENFAGALGDGSSENRRVPTRVTGGLTFVSITAGSDHTCALTAAGEAYCWGENDNGELGRGFVSTQLTGLATPGRVVTSARFASISAGAEHVCALSTLGAAYCWGWNQWGQLGRSGRPDLPDLVDETQVFASISGGLAHTCALDTTGKAFCWGISAFGELGDGLPIRPTSPMAVNRPVAVTGNLLFSRVSTGASHVCALTVSRSLYCWGHRENGALGIP